MAVENQSMKAVIVHQAGGPDVLQVQDIAKPTLKEGWTLIKVQGFGINHSEIFTRQGLSPSVVFPRVLGIECVGIVEATTSSALEVGQQVVSLMGEMGRDFDGGYAEYVLVPNQQVYPVTTRLDLDSLIALPETYHTAFGAYQNLKIEAGDRVLVRAATSGVGIAFAKLLKGQFPDTYLAGTSRNLNKEGQLKQAGFDQIILDVDGILDTDETFTKIIDLVGPRDIKDSLAHLFEGGIICSCGQLGGQWTLADFDPIMELRRNVYLTTFYSDNVSTKQIQDLIDFVERYGIDVRPEKVFGLEEIQKAHAYLEGGKSFGKVIVKIKERE